MAPILVVDDEADLVANYERLLRRKGFQVVSAGTRGDGLALVERAPIALLITDLRLPDGDGLDLVRAARRLPTPPPSTGIGSTTQTRVVAVDAGTGEMSYAPKESRRD
jgi:DNA-binding response OmpR family regulator